MLRPLANCTVGAEERNGTTAGGGRAAGGRERVMAAGVALSVFILSWMLFSWPSNQEIELSFVRFNHHNNELHAWCWFTNGARPSVWSIQSVSHKIDGEWMDDGQANVTIHEKLPDWEKWPAVDAAHQVYLLSFKVREAKLPLRVILLVQERSSGLTGLKETLQQWDNDYWHRKSYVVAGGRRYYVTNEFSVHP